MPCCFVCCVGGNLKHCGKCLQSYHLQCLDKPHNEKKHIEVSGTRQIPIKTVPTSLDEVPSQRDAYGNKSSGKKVGSSSNANGGALVDDNNVGGRLVSQLVMNSDVIIADFTKSYLMHEEEQLHDEEKTGSDALKQAGEVLGQSAQSAMDVEVLCMDHLRKSSDTRDSSSEAATLCKPGKTHALIRDEAQVLSSADLKATETPRLGRSLPYLDLFVIPTGRTSLISRNAFEPVILSIHIVFNLFILD
ncbi:unnamed protein product [Prunus brigantina]